MLAVGAPPSPLRPRRRVTRTHPAGTATGIRPTARGQRPDGRGQIFSERLEAFLRELREPQQSGSQATGSPDAAGEEPHADPHHDGADHHPRRPTTGAARGDGPRHPPRPRPTAAIATATPLGHPSARHIRDRRARRLSVRDAGRPGGRVAAAAGGVSRRTRRRRGSARRSPGGWAAPRRTACSSPWSARCSSSVAIQSRMDRRDPRIARARSTAYRDFRDFE